MKKLRLRKLPLPAPQPERSWLVLVQDPCYHTGRCPPAHKFGGYEGWLWLFNAKDAGSCFTGFSLQLSLVKGGQVQTLIIGPFGVGQRGKGRPKMGVAGVAAGVAGEAVCPVTTGRPADTGPESRALVPIGRPVRTQ